MKMLKFFLLFFLALSLHGYCQQTDTTQWTILLGGKQAGFLKKWKNNNNSYTEWYQWNDRGRGDSTRTTYTYNEKGYIISLLGTGVDYFKKPLTEKFDKKGPLSSPFLLTSLTLYNPIDICEESTTLAPPFIFTMFATEPFTDNSDSSMALKFILAVSALYSCAAKCNSYSPSSKKASFCQTLLCE